MYNQLSFLSSNSQWIQYTVSLSSVANVSTIYAQYYSFSHLSLAEKFPTLYTKFKFDFRYSYGNFCSFALLLSSDFAFSRVINSLLEIIQIIHVIPQFFVLVGWWGYLWRRYRIELNWIELKQATLRQHVLLSLN